MADQSHLQKLRVNIPLLIKCLGVLILGAVLAGCDDNGKIWQETPTGLYIEKSRYEQADRRPSDWALQKHFLLGKYEGIKQEEQPK